MVRGKASFSFAANSVAKIERSQTALRQDRPESDNGDYTAYVLATRDARICARFWSHALVRPKNACWIWTANVVGHGNKTHPSNSRHGQFTYRLHPSSPYGGLTRQHHIYAHRFSWALAHGPIPNGLQVLHKCDVPPCINPDHLFLGTHADNMKDAAQKQRFTVPRTRTLSLFDRLIIYNAPPTGGVCVELAKQFGVTVAAISIIRRGRFIGSGVWVGTKSHSQDARKDFASHRAGASR